MPDRSLHLETFPLGDWMTNCYVVHDTPGKRCFIIDAGFEPQAMLAFIEERGLTVDKIVLTHAHLDHIGGLWDVHRAHPAAPILIHEAEREWLADTTLNLSAFIGLAVTGPEPTRLLKHGDTLTLGDGSGGHTFEVRHTPGHSPGGITLYNAPHRFALVGDTVFEGSVGRYDFPTSDGAQLMQSIKTQLYTLPDGTRILPGHGSDSTIGIEKRSNPYVRG